MTSPDTFFIFSKFCFSGLLGGRGLKGQKMAQMTKNYVSLHISGTVPHMIVVFGTDM